MTSRRNLIRMDEKEIRQYLYDQRRIIVVTIGPEGMPYPVPMSYGIDNAGRVIITTFRKCQKIANLQRDPRATLLVESGDKYHELKSVIVYADADIIVDPDLMAANMRLIRSSNLLAATKTPEMDEQIRASMAKRVVVLFTPYKFVSWDHSKLGTYY